MFGCHRNVTIRKKIDACFGRAKRGLRKTPRRLHLRVTNADRRFKSSANDAHFRAHENAESDLKSLGSQGPCRFESCSRH